MSSTGPIPGDPSRIVIGNEDLDNSIPIEPAGTRSTTSSYTSNTAQYGLPPVPPQPTPIPVHVPPAAGTGDLLTKLSANTIVSGLVAGAVGGFLGFLLAENAYNPEKISARTSGGLDVESAVWTMIFAAVLGFVLMGWEGFTSRSAQKTFRDGGIGAGIGVASGFIGGYIAQWVYAKMLGNNPLSLSDSKLILARMVGWAVLGGLLGAGLGIKGGTKKFVNGLIGGVVGGAIGGLIFQLIGNSSQSTNGFVTRMIGLTLTGIGIGLGVGIVERVRRDNWIQIVGGPMTGKEFIIYNAETRVGRDYRNDIVMAKDAAVQPFHATFICDPSGRVSVVPGPGATIFVNGTASAGSQLRSRDLVSIGGSSLAYQERAVT